MEGWKGNRRPEDPQEGYYVGLMNACGYRISDLKKPVTVSYTHLDVYKRQA